MESVYQNELTSRQRILNEKQTESVIEKITYEGGVKLYIKGIPFPQKSCPTPESIIAINTVKRVLISFFNVRCMPTSKHKLIKAFNRITLDVMYQHILKEKYMTAFARELKIFIYNFLIAWNINKEEARQTSQILSHVFEFDNAYRYRMQDLLNETSKEKITSRKEVIKLARIAYERDDVQSIEQGGDRRVGKQFVKIAKYGSFLLYIPGVKRALKTALNQCEWQNFLMDDSDLYWSNLRKDYNFRGLTYNERNGI